MRPLFTSFFCPKDCDRRGNELTMNVGDSRWRLQRIRIGEVIPEWATHGWWLFDGDSLKRESMMTTTERLIELLEADWEYRHEPGWKLESRSLIPGMKFSNDGAGLCEMLAFGRSGDH